MRAIITVLLFALLCPPCVYAGRPAQTTPAIQTIYVVPSSHWDYGFTDPPPNLPALFKAHLDDVVAKCNANAGYRYTIESVWALEDYISVSTPQQIEAVMSLVRAGRIAVSSSYCGPHSGIMSPEELNRWTYRTERIRTTYDIPSRTAHVNDNPGYTWALPDALSGAGVGRLVCGPNPGLSAAFPLPLSQTLFRWQGPGGGRVLTWVARDGYTDGIEFWHVDANAARLLYGAQHPEWSGWTNQQIIEQGVTKEVADLQNAGYAYDSVLVMLSFDKLNLDSSGAMIGDIATWNATHTSPQIRLATADEFFDHMTATYGADAFPLYTGNWTQRWERVKVYGQMAQSRYREVRDGLLAGETLATVGSLFGAPYPAATIGQAYRDLMRFDDHGAGPNLTSAYEMTLDELNQSNLYFMQTSLARQNDVRALVASGVAGLAAQVATSPGASPEVVVVNPLSSPRTDAVNVAVDSGGQPFALRDVSTGAAVPYQARGDGTIDFVAEDVPPLGYRRYRVLLGVSDPPAAGVTASGTVVESPFYRVTVSPSTGAITSIVDKTSGDRQLVDSASAYSFNRTLRADNAVDYGGGTPTTLTTGTPAVAASPGPVAGSLTVEFSSPGTTLASPLSRVEIRLYAKLKRIDVVDTFDRSRLQYVVGANKHSQHFYAPMPFALDAATFAPRVESNGGAPLVPPTSTYLSSPPAVAVNNSHYPPHVAVLREASGYQVEVASPQAFQFTVGSINAWTYPSPPAPTLFWEPLVKSDRTVTDDPGKPTVPFVVEPLENDPSQGYTVYTSQFTITSGGTRADSTSHAFGAGVASPLRAATLPGGHAGALTAAAASLFSVDAPNVEILTIKRPDFGDQSDVVVRVRELDGVATTAHLHSSFAVLSASEATLLEAATAPLATSPLAVALGPYQTKTLRLRLGAYAPRGARTAGIYVSSTGGWFVKNSNGPGAADVAFGYGPPGAVPLAGDWDGDGVETPGIYVPSTGSFFLKNSLGGGAADVTFNFGPGGAALVPLAGDWDGDGRTSVGLYDPSTGAFFLKNALGPGAADAVFGYGPPGATPLAGDWNGDGVDTIGIYVAATGAFFLRNSNSSGAADVTFNFGPAGATPLAGDWNGDGSATVGIYLPGSGTFFLKNSNAPGAADLAFAFGPPGATPVVGDWDGL